MILRKLLVLTLAAAAALLAIHDSNAQATPGSGLAVTSVAPAGPPGQPYDVLTVTFNRPVQPASLAADVDISLVAGPAPVAGLALKQISGAVFQIDASGKTGAGEYSLTIGPGISAEDGTLMDQDGDGAPGESAADAYVARLYSTAAAIPSGDSTLDAVHILVAEKTLVISGNHRFASLAIFRGGTVTSDTGRLELALTKSLVIDEQSSIDMSGHGYGENTTTGGKVDAQGRGSSGGTYGGLGTEENGQTNTSYGDFRNPDDLGSGGGGDRGSGGAGGGLVRIIASQATINGAVRADGNGGVDANFRQGGGGSGGGIRLETGLLSGSGEITARGAPGAYGQRGAGGGGRIAVYYKELQGFDLVRISAVGAAHSNKDSAAAPGTVYTQKGQELGTLEIESRGARAGMQTPLGNAGSTSVELGNLVVSGKGVVAAPAARSVKLRAQSVTIRNGAVLTQRGYGPDGDDALLLEVAGTLAIGAGSAIDVSGRGYGENTTLGGVVDVSARGNSGGAYGGVGVEINGRSNRTYGSFLDPNEPGSGGGGDRGSGGAGGGLARISAGSVVLDGAILANGNGGADVNYRQGGGGSGGGIRIDAGSLAGTGEITANGATGAYGQQGAGGGGRIAIYYRELQGFDLKRATSIGAAQSNTGAAAGVGTVYLQKGSGPGTLVIDSHGSRAGMWTPLGGYSQRRVSAGAIEVSGKGVVTAPAARNATISTASLLVKDGAVLTSQGGFDGASVDSLTLVVSGTVTVGAGSAIDVSSRGYGISQTVGGSAVDASGGSSGGSYGGLGFAQNGPVNRTYGSAEFPDEAGSGGAGERGTGGAGGGLVRIIATKAVISGSVLANGGNGVDANYRTGGGGSGGGILLNVGELSGSGKISADGGSGAYGRHGGGGGGRIAVYSWGQVTLPKENVTVVGGSEEPYRGKPGSIYFAAGPGFFWGDARSRLFHDTRMLSWAGLGADFATTTAELSAVRDGQTTVIAQELPAVGEFAWDTSTVADGLYELRVSFAGPGQGLPSSVTRPVLVNNGVTWHGDTANGSETWTRDTVHVVERSLLVGKDAKVEVEPGAVVKLARGVKIVVDEGGSFAAPATTSAPIVFTSLADDTAGGDSNLDGSDTRPLPGDWGSVSVRGNGRATLSPEVDLRYGIALHSDSLGGSETWIGSFVHYVTRNIAVPGGATLTIEPGAVVKFAGKVELNLQGGAKLIARGSLAQPIIFTSDRDDSLGGDTNADGDQSGPAAGDWRWINISGANAELDYVQVLYGGGTGSGNWDGTGVLRVGEDGTLNLSNSVVRDAFFDGVIGYGSKIAITSTVFTGIDRAVDAQGGSVIDLINSTLDDNRIALLAHGGKLNVGNSIVTNSADAGIQDDFKTLGTVRYTNVWNPGDSAGQTYSNTPVVSGRDGNISVDPLYRNPEAGNFRLSPRSPAIDAADGIVAPATDFSGAPRFDSPRAPNTGTPSPAGGIPDMGAFELAEDAQSDIDLVVSGVSGPEKVVAGQTATVTWTVTNTGSGSLRGPWRDAVSLAGAEILVAGTAVTGQGAILGPGESVASSARIAVPGGTPGAYRWQVTANSSDDIFEGRNRDNNSTVASSATDLDLAELAIGAAPVSDRFAAAGEVRWYRLLVPAGQDAVVSIDRSGAGGSTEVYSRRGQAPSLNEYDARSPEWNSPDATVVAAGGPGAVYIMARASSLPLASEFTVSARTMEFGLISATPTRAGNAGPVTVLLRGGGLRPSMAFSLTGPDGKAVNAAVAVVPDPTTAFATFDLAGVPAGRYTAAVQAGDSRKALDGALEVSAGGGPVLSVQIIVPSAARSKRQFEGYVVYRNEGDTDMPSPLLGLSSRGTAQMKLNQMQGLVDGDLQIVAVSPDGPAGVLRPGGEGRVRFSAMTESAQPASFSVSATEATSGARIEWAAFEASVRPDGVNAARWSAAWDALRSASGETWGGYVKAISSAVTNAATEGERIESGGQALSVAISRYLAETSHNVGGRVSLDGEPLADVLVMLVSEDGRGSAAAVTHSDGSFSMAVDNNTYAFSVPGYLLHAKQSVTVPSVAAKAVNVSVTRGGRISGFVAGAGAGGVSVFAVGRDGIGHLARMTPAGGYEITGLPDGAYSVTVSGAGIAMQTRHGVTVAGDNFDAQANFVVSAPAELAGILTAASGGRPVQGARISLSGPAGAVMNAKTDAQGRFALGGLLPGIWSVSVTGSGYAATQAASVSLISGESSRLAVSLAAESVLSVTVRRDDTGSPAGDSLVLVRPVGRRDVVLGVAVTDASGEATVRGLPAGRLDVTVSTDGLAPAQDSVLLAEGQTLETEYVLGAPPRISLALPSSRPGPASIMAVPVNFGAGARTLALPAGSMDAAGGSATSRLNAYTVPRPLEGGGAVVGLFSDINSAWTFEEAATRGVSLRPNTGITTFIADLLAYLENRNPTPQRAPGDDGYVPLIEPDPECDPALVAWSKAVIARSHKDAAWDNWVATHDNYNSTVRYGAAIFVTDFTNLAANIAALYVNPADAELLIGAASYAQLNALLQSGIVLASAYNQISSGLPNIDWSDPVGAMASVSGVVNNAAQISSGGYQLYDVYLALRQLGPSSGLPTAFLGRVGALTQALNTFFDLRDSVNALINSVNTVTDAESNYRQAWLDFYARNQAIARANEECKKPKTPTPIPASVTPGATAVTTVVSSVDPNEKRVSGFSAGGHVREGTDILFEIFFENVSTASAAAQRVVVVDRLDPKLDWATLSLGSVSFNGVTLTVPPGRTSFSGIARVASDPNLVKVTAALDPATGTLNWTMRSVDAVTGGEPSDPFAGFLPPNNASHRGEGSVTFTVRLKPDLTSGDSLRNSATITFDENEPIITNSTTTTLDAGVPSSQVRSLPAQTPGSEVKVEWSGTDAQNGSGIAFYDVYASVDGGPFTPWLKSTKETSGTYAGEAGKKYAFYSVATDNVGNKETPRAAADAETTLQGGAVPTVSAAPTALAGGGTGLEPSAGGSGSRVIFIVIAVSAFAVVGVGAALMLMRGRKATG